MKPIVFVFAALASGLLLGCPRKKPMIDDAGPSAKNAPAAPASSAWQAESVPPPDAGAAFEPPLVWGTRPPRSAELYVALDGRCEMMTVNTVIDGTIIGYEPEQFGRLTADGIDLDVRKGVDALNVEGERHWFFDTHSGRIDDLWGSNVHGGSVFHEVSIAQRKNGRWKDVAPLGKDKVHYTPPQSWRGGSLGLAIAVEFNEARDSKVVGYDLPKEVVVGRLFPADVDVRELHAIDSGEVLALGRRTSGDLGLWMLGPSDTVARPLRTITTKGIVKLTGHSRKTFRVDTEEKRYRLEKNDLIEEEVENALLWRANGKTLQHLVGAGYQDVVLPPLPMSNVVPTFDSLEIAPDGEAIVAVTWPVTSEYRMVTSFHALLRSHRPPETLRCSEHVDSDGSLGIDHKPATPNGLEHWPPRATEGCATPFVVVARYSHRDRVPKDLPKARAALAKDEEKTGLAASSLSFVTVDTGGRHVMGLRASSFAQATSISEALTKELRLQPEIVCANPEPTSKPDGG